VQGQRFAYQKHMLAQIALLHDLAGPKFIQQLGLADDAIAMIYQVQE